MGGADNVKTEAEGVLTVDVELTATGTSLKAEGNTELSRGANGGANDTIGPAGHAIETVCP